VRECAFASSIEPFGSVTYIERLQSLNVTALTSLSALPTSEATWQPVGVLASGTRNSKWKCAVVETVPHSLDHTPSCVGRVRSGDADAEPHVGSKSMTTLRLESLVRYCLPHGHT